MTPLLYQIEGRKPELDFLLFMSHYPVFLQCPVLLENQKLRMTHQNDTLLSRKSG